MTDAPIRSVLDEDHGSLRPSASVPTELVSFTVDDLAQEIRRVDGSNALGAGALAEALSPFLIEMLVAHRKRVISAIENSHSPALGGYEGPQGRSEPKPVDPTTAGEVEADLIERLRKVESNTSRAAIRGVVTNWHRNPDGPEAAQAISTLQAEIERLRARVRMFESLDQMTLGGSHE